MRILAIETATAEGSVALLEGDRVLRQVVASVPQRHLEWLAPAIDQALQAVGWRPAEVQAVAVSRGPGTFTGVRIGVATAAAWARATGIPLVAVSTLETLAAGVEEGGLICPVLDARRGEVVGALFEGDGALRRVTEDFVVPVEALLAELPKDRSVVLAGDALARYGEVLRAHPQVRLARADRWVPRAATTGRLALTRLLRGEHDDPYRVVPTYARPAPVAVSRA
ncbi:MAG: tRNA (adenosine(37)-N6)-threonylcarbamoyltransferase complex dimerization subunit type 1 TsaB [Armatimonadota bacterium]|nr:tRNA (adenosine(37)-N6)-threonylcarbamoyltransferase complex dimerization subunit type 1 TsaB [Armatimonadota bacterium]MDR7452595.1 tRNA (adenosine(37)-N6)-threonylcarbamoyltransferase complex dimerization subunit type 1 TsaB [Armatimonadota bacterium]MDR7468244.1 tRNA (adenosine(37)-N6)-threonylcarbamoyltransferase complex dimerization subunit type 1 TsaB [Armatimonadota bacterium]MDR7495238.1 tRNA (adenosine(37)-N6)-threonylcarbamoyltransferase complex dimerization subunit type 1 TsaB [Arm